jgi:hypothetical protein
MPVVVALLALMFIAAGGLVVAGVYLVFGLAWSLIASGVLIFGAAVHIRAGLKTNG